MLHAVICNSWVEPGNRGRATGVGKWQTRLRWHTIIIRTQNNNNCAIRSIHGVDHASPSNTALGNTQRVDGSDELEAIIIEAVSSCHWAYHHGLFAMASITLIRFHFPNKSRLSCPSPISLPMSPGTPPRPAFISADSTLSVFHSSSFGELRRSSWVTTLPQSSG